MKNVGIFDGEFTYEQVKNNPDKLFVFGDNQMRIGKEGQTFIRDLPNVLSIRIKKGPSQKPAAFYTDSDFILFKNNLLEDITNIKTKAIQDKTIILTSKGYGNSEKIEHFSIKVKEYLDEYLKRNLQFDNTTGKKYISPPTNADIANAKSISVDNLTYNNLDTFIQFDAILKQRKIAFTFDKDIEVGSLLKFVSSKSEDVVVCRVVDCYSCYLIGESNWSILEFCDASAYSKEKYQVQFDFICSVNKGGTIRFNNDFFTLTKTKDEPESIKVDESSKQTAKIIEPVKKEEVSTVNTTEEDETIEEPELKKEKIKNKNEVIISTDLISNQQIYHMLIEMNSKIDELSDKINNNKKTSDLFNKIKSCFKRQTLDELLIKNEIVGTIHQINKDTFEVNSTEKTYFIKYKSGIFTNSLKILFVKENK